MRDTEGVTQNSMVKGRQGEDACGAALVAQAIFGVVYVLTVGQLAIATFRA